MLEGDTRHQFNLPSNRLCRRGGASCAVSACTAGLLRRWQAGRLASTLLPNQARTQRERGVCSSACCVGVGGGWELWGFVCWGRLVWGTPATTRLLLPSELFPRSSSPGGVGGQDGGLISMFSHKVEPGFSHLAKPPRRQPGGCIHPKGCRGPRACSGSMRPSPSQEVPCGWAS